MLVSPIDAIDAIDLGNEIVAHLAPGVAAAFVGQRAVGPIALLEALGMASAAFGGKLGVFLPRILAGTTAIVANVKYELGKGREELNRLLNAHPLALAPLVSFAAEVQFARFFSESALDAARATMRSLSEGFSQSMSAIGSSTA